MNWQTVTGYISPDLIKAGGAAWAAAWMQKAIEAEKSGNELIVIEVKPDEVYVSSESASGELFLEPFI